MAFYSNNFGTLGNLVAPYLQQLTAAAAGTPAPNATNYAAAVTNVAATAATAASTIAQNLSSRMAANPTTATDGSPESN